MRPCQVRQEKKNVMFRHTFQKFILEQKKKKKVVKHELANSYLIKMKVIKTPNQLQPNK
jgi:hypothetical protein